MQNMNPSMPQMNEGCVLTCTVTECTFNQSEACHAPNINVGQTHPACDTFTTSDVQPVDQGMPDIAVCNVSVCEFNQSNDCKAPGITVAHHSNHADCLTFRNSM
ncbi:MAG TPA: DUF1540 domain-containing protein [Candidatus Aquicultor sp.]|jgi:hypothetical protein